MICASSSAFASALVLYSTVGFSITLISKLFAFSTADIKSVECTSSKDSLDSVGVAVVSTGASVGVVASVGVAVVSAVVSAGASVGVAVVSSAGVVGVAVVSANASVGLASEVGACVVTAVSVAGATGFTSSANV